MSDEKKYGGHDVKAAQELRRRAERQAEAEAAEDVSSLNLDEAKRLLHELRVHQIELEMQNEELRRAQLALDASRARYFDLYDLAPVGYVTLSERGLILEANLRACTMLGINRETLVRQPLTRFIVADDQDIYYKHRKQLFDTGDPQSCELRMQPLDGAQIWARLEATLADDEEQSAPVCRVTLSDITEKTKLQAQLALADRLSSVGLLAASISHEVNNPLTYVLYNLETLADDLPALARRLAGSASLVASGEGDMASAGQEAKIRIELEDMIERARSAVEGAHRIRDLMKGMRAFSHVDEELIEPLSFNRIIETALTMTAREINSRARLVKNLGRVPPVSANHGKLCQVFVNLLVNATHATKEGHVDDNEISIRTWSEGGDVLAEISDSGCGIPTETQNRIFDPFFTTKPVGSGTGLGLSICMKIVTALGGMLTVASTPGKGSTFTVRVPATVSDDKDRAQRDLDSGSESATAEPKGRILIIDDEALVREALVGMLKGHEVVVASSGIEGRTILGEDEAFDVILCDLMMPDFAGMDLHAWLSERSPRLAKQLIFVTGGAFTPRAREHLSKVDNVSLEKPLDVANLKKIVSDHVARAKGTKDALR